MYVPGFGVVEFPVLVKQEVHLKSRDSHSWSSPVALLKSWSPKLSPSQIFDIKVILLVPEEKGWDFVDARDFVLQSRHFSSCRFVVDRRPF